MNPSKPEPDILYISPQEDSPHDGAVRDVDAASRESVESRDIGSRSSLDHFASRVQKTRPALPTCLNAPAGTNPPVPAVSSSSIMQILRASCTHKEPEFSELTSDEIASIKFLQDGDRPDGEIVYNNFRITITRAILRTLAGTNCLNDEIINYYLAMVDDRASRLPTLYPSVYTFTSFFWNSLTKKGYPSVHRWTRKVTLSGYSMVLIPFRERAHWSLLVGDNTNKQIRLYDSLHRPIEHHLGQISIYMQREYNRPGQPPLDMSQWTSWQSRDFPKEFPRQENGWDCGVYMCRYAEYASRRAMLNFARDRMPYYRQRIAYEIIQGFLFGTKPSPG